MRINPDTKDALIFATGLLGMLVQGILPFFGIAPSVPLIGAWLTMMGFGAASSIIGGSRRKNDDRLEQDPDDEQPPPKPKRAAGTGGPNAS